MEMVPQAGASNTCHAIQTGYIWLHLGYGLLMDVILSHQDSNAILSGLCLPAWHFSILSAVSFTKTAVESGVHTGF